MLTDNPSLTWHTWRRPDMWYILQFRCTLLVPSAIYTLSRERADAGFGDGIWQWVFSTAVFRFQWWWNRFLLSCPKDGGRVFNSEWGTALSGLNGVISLIWSRLTEYGLGSPDNHRVGNTTIHNREAFRNAVNVCSRLVLALAMAVFLMNLKSTCQTVYLMTELYVIVQGCCQRFI